MVDYASFLPPGALGAAEEEKPEKCPMVPGMAYVPVQQWEEMYEPDVGFARGTVFRQLDLPFLGKEGLRL